MHGSSYINIGILSIGGDGACMIFHTRFMAECKHIFIYLLSLFKIFGPEIIFFKEIIKISSVFPGRCSRFADVAFGKF